MTAHENPLVILLPELALGGLLRHASEVARQARLEGQPATIISVRGERDVSEHLAGLEVRLVDSWSGAGQKQVLQWMEGAEVLLLSPRRRRCWRRRSAWRGARRWECMARPEPTGSGSARSASRCWPPPLARRGDPRCSSPGRRTSTAWRESFGISPGQVSVLPNAIPLPETLPMTRPGMGSVLTAMRLANDKRWVLEAAARLATAGRVPLKVVGQGPHADEFRAWLGSRPGLSAEVIETEDFDTHLREADVVVAVGLVALEAAARGRRVAVAAKPGGGLAGALTPSNWAALQATNFAGLGLPEQPPAEVWTTLGEMTAKDLEDVAGLVERTASPRALLETLRRHLRPVQPPAPGRLIMAFADLTASLEQRAARLAHDASELEKARDWWHQQAQAAGTQLREATAYLGEVEKARDWWHQQAQAAGTQLQEATAYLGEVEKARDWWHQQAGRTADKNP
ncbi:hypothetical protein ACN28I_01095 [Archangium gephyra]|uniref:hypothetical protein n=1 Tax=Archangium gephyra TaxID=48 RepID=UPI003B7D5069